MLRLPLKIGGRVQEEADKRGIEASSLLAVLVECGLEALMTGEFYYHEGNDADQIDVLEDYSDVDYVKEVVQPSATK